MSFRSVLPTVIVAVVCLVFAVSPAAAQSLEIEPASPTLQVGQSQQLEAFYVSADEERRRDTTVVFLARNGNAAPVTRSGEVTANEPGTHEIIALRPGTDTQDRLVQRVSVTVAQAPVETVAFAGAPERIYAGTQMPLAVEARTADGRIRDDVTVRVESSDPDVATVDRLHRVRGEA
ncbi:MAG: Ig-like domain-containing protein, partial [Salinibacter sp.]